MTFTPADFWPPGPPTGGAATDQTARDAAAAAQSTANAAVSTGAELAPLLADPAATPTLRTQARSPATPLEFGGIGDGTSRPLSTAYGSLAAAQAVYPHAVALTDELDWAAIQAAANSGAKRVYYPNGYHWITNRMITPANYQTHYGDGFDSFVENILPRNTPSADQLQSCGFEIGNMHGAILGTDPTLKWSNTALNLVTLGDGTFTVTTPGNVPANKLNVGDIIVITSSNTALGPVTVGAGREYDFAMWNKVVSYDRVTGVLVLKYAVPVAIAAAVSTATILEGPLVWWNDHSDTVRGTAWWVLQGATIRDLRVKALVPLSYRSAAFECNFRNIVADDCQYVLEANAHAFCHFSNIKGRASGRTIGEVKQWSHNNVFEHIHGEHWSDPGVAQGTGFSIGEQSYDNLFFDIRLKRGTGYTGSARPLEIWAPSNRFVNCTIEDYGTSSTSLVAIKSTEHLAVPPKGILLANLASRGKSIVTAHVLVGNVSTNGGDPIKVMIDGLDTLASGVVANAVQVVRGTYVDTARLTGDTLKVTSANPGHLPTGGAWSPVAVTQAGVLAGASFTVALVPVGCQIGDRITGWLQTNMANWAVVVDITGTSAATATITNKSAGTLSLSTVVLYCVFNRNRL